MTLTIIVSLFGTLLIILSIVIVVKNRKLKKLTNSNQSIGIENQPPPYTNFTNESSNKATTSYR